MELLPKTDMTGVERFVRSFTSQHTRDAYRRDIKDYAAFANGRDPQAFDTLAAYRDHLISTSAPATVTRRFSAVKSFFAFLASEGTIMFNPCVNLSVPRSRALEPTLAFDDADVTKVLSQPDVYSFQGSMHRLALVLLFNLGLRRSELVKLKVGSVREHRGNRFLVVEGKGSKERLVPITPGVFEEINAYLVRYSDYTDEALVAADYLLQSDWRTKNAKPVDPSTVYRIVRNYSRDAGVSKRVSPHSCRATVISHLLEKNVSPRMVADLVGHSSVSTTVGIYDRKRDAITNPAASMVTYERQG